MNVFIIGITGLLGSEAARELLARGHKVAGLALPRLPKGFTLQDQVELIFGDYIALSEEAIIHI